MPWLQRYVDIIAFSIVIHVGFSITIIFHFISLQDAENSFNDCSFFIQFRRLLIEKIELQSPIAVANFIIGVAKKEENPVTNLKLQEILFFLQGYCLNKYNRALFDGKFAKWQYGPVEEEIYQIFKSQGSMPINFLSTQAKIENGIIKLHRKEINLSQEYTEELKSVVIKINQKAPWELYELTHKHSSWYSYKDDINRGIASDYTNNEIEKCFKDNFRGMLNQLS
ncbi:Panacea domain-containing protein [Ligilactobacillus salivarius]|nr:type II toxin-antitoxin system antitoxin SocA domain-containing protein [Ligilactobacillus salivarius]